MLAQVGSFVLGALLLLLASDSLVRGVSGLALRSGFGGYSVGLASTAFGALIPALVVTLAAGYARQPELALGALVGGSIAQIGLVLGICALAAPLRARFNIGLGCGGGAIGGPCDLSVTAHDALGFAQNPGADTPLSAGETTLDGCGRYRFANLTTSSSGYVAIVTDDAPGGTTYMPLAPSVMMKSVTRSRAAA